MRCESPTPRVRMSRSESAGWTSRVAIAYQKKEGTTEGKMLFESESNKNEK